MVSNISTVIEQPDLSQQISTACFLKRQDNPGWRGNMLKNVKDYVENGVQHVYSVSWQSQDMWRV